MTSFLLKLFSASLIFAPNISFDSFLDYNVTPPPYEFELINESEITAKSVVILDLDSESVVYKKNADERRAMASLTKLMTALIIFENHKPDEVVKITNKMRDIEPAKIWLVENEDITVLNLVRALLIPSANDAALALAIYDSVTVEKFAEKMNIRAYWLGLENTQFKNPHGLDEESHYSSARDIAFLSAYLLKRLDSDWEDIFINTISTKQRTIKSVNEKIEHELKTTNDLLETNLPIFGMKTGSTDNAGQCLVTLFRNDKNLLIVVLGSKDRFGDTKKIIESIEQ